MWPFEKQSGTSAPWEIPLVSALRRLNHCVFVIKYDLEGHSVSQFLGQIHTKVTRFSGFSPCGFVSPDVPSTVPR